MTRVQKIEQVNSEFADLVDERLQADARFAQSNGRCRRLKLAVDLIRDTPFVILYEFDHAALRAHFVLHRRTLGGLEPKPVDW